MLPTLHFWPVGSPGQGWSTGSSGPLFHGPGFPEELSFSPPTGQHDHPCPLSRGPGRPAFHTGFWEIWVRQQFVWGWEGAGFGTQHCRPKRRMCSGNKRATGPGRGNSILKQGKAPQNHRRPHSLNSPMHVLQNRALLSASWRLNR